jgi:hypothetical protein
MRILNRILALIVSLALIAVGVIVIIEVIAAQSNSSPVIINWHATLRWGQSHSWSNTTIIVISAITAAVGLLLLIVQVWRRKPARLTIVSGAATDAALTRKGVGVSIRAAVVDVEGIASSKVKVGRRRIRVIARSTATRAHTAEELKTEVDKAAATQLESLHLRNSRRLRVSVVTRDQVPATDDEQKVQPTMHDAPEPPEKVAAVAGDTAQPREGGEG